MLFWVRNNGCWFQAHPGTKRKPRRAYSMQHKLCRCFSIFLPNLYAGVRVLFDQTISAERMGPQVLLSLRVDGLWKQCVQGYSIKDPCQSGAGALLNALTWATHSELCLSSVHFRINKNKTESESPPARPGVQGASQGGFATDMLWAHLRDGQHKHPAGS